MVNQVTQFVAHPPGSQDVETYRQFVQLQAYVQELEERLKPVSARLTYADITLTDAWQELTLVSGSEPDEPGVYSVTITGAATGSNANAEMQSRLIVDGVIYEGEVRFVGNNVLTFISILFVTRGAGAALEVRGINTVLGNIVVYLERIGT